jgi:uncharacterized lipoprotein YddW (UPF0748 family)
MTRRRELCLAAAAAAAVSGSGCAGWPPAAPVATTGLPDAELPPPAPREFRGAWVATVANIDWPSKPGLTSDEQQAEMRRLLDRAREIGLNAIVLQVRPATDAIYPSRLEPWSEYLTGAQGEAPQPMYDPLAMWLREAHRRGLELHAWFNPYRAWHPSAKSPPAASHVSQRQPQLVRRYGTLQWLDPGEPDAAAHTLAVIADVLRRYAVDGVHVDDYFYPYPIRQPVAAPATTAATTPTTSPATTPAISAVDQPFPDDAPYQRYRDGGGTLERDDWRRDNVNRLIEAMHDTVRRVRPAARFGISPFGIGRPGLRPEGIVGFSQYDRLYADVEHWVQKGWFDYLVPQLYWPIEQRAQAFPLLLDYWASRVAATDAGARHHWPGLYTSSIAGPVPAARAWKADEILAQIALMRERGAQVAGGHIHFSMVALLQDRDGVATRLREGAYRDDALAPASPWLAAPAPAAPAVSAFPGRLRVWQGPGEAVLTWALWRRVGGRWRFSTMPGHETQLPTLGADAVVVSAVSPAAVESPRVALRLLAG